MEVSFALFVVILSALVFIICGAIARRAGTPGSDLGIVSDIKELSGYAFLAGMIGLVIKGITV